MQVTHATSLSTWDNEVVSDMVEDTLKKLLELLGWEDVSPQIHLGEEFDLVGSRWFSSSGLLRTRWNVVVKYIDVFFGDEEVQQWMKTFHYISSKSKRLNRCFLLCLIAGKVEIDPGYLTQERDSYSSDQGGGGNIFVVDLVKGMIHGTVA